VRRETLSTIRQSSKWVEILDDSFVPVLQSVAADPDPQVRREVAGLAGYRWLWVPPAVPQDPNVIALMLQLSADSDREVRYNAVYYGLSVVRGKSEPVVRRLIRLAATDADNDLFGRTVWGLKSGVDTTPPLFTRAWAAQWQNAGTDDEKAALRRLYREVLGREPPAGPGR